MGLNNHVLILAVAISSLLISVDATRAVSSPASSIININNAPSPSSTSIIPLASLSVHGLEALIEAYLNEAISKAEIALDSFRNNIKTGSYVNEFEGSCQNMCEANYDFLLSYLKESKDEVYDGDFFSLTDAMGKIQTRLDNCRVCYREQASGIKNPVQDYQDKLSSITDSAMELLQMTS